MQSPWLPIYCVTTDLPSLVGLLEDDIAFIVSDGKRRWRATRECPVPIAAKTILWHVSSGPLPLVRDNQGLPPDVIADPWNGWTEVRTGADPKVPYFGADFAGVFSLNLRLRGRESGSLCGLSSFGWVGNRHALIENPAPQATEKRWKKLRRQVAAIAQKVPRGGAGSGHPAEVWAFPGASELLGKADINPY